jgi:type II secretory pathway component PulJ
VSKPSGRPLRVWALTTATAVAALLAQWHLVRPLTMDLPDGESFVWLAIVTIGFVVTELCIVHLRLGRHAYSFSLSEVPLVVGLFFTQPELLALAWPLGSLVALAWRRLQLRKAAFNLALVALEAAVAVMVWHAVLGDSDPYGPWGWVSTIVVALVVSVLSSTLVSVAIAADTGALPSKLSDVLSLGQVADLVNAVFALVVVYVVSVDWRASWIVAVVVVILVLAHRVSERLQLRTERLEQLNRFTGKVGRQLDTDAVVRSVLVHVREAMEAQVLQIRIADQQGGHRAWALARQQSEPLAVETAGLLDAFCRSEVSEPVLVPGNTRNPALRESLSSAGSTGRSSAPSPSPTGWATWTRSRPTTCSSSRPWPTTPASRWRTPGAPTCCAGRQPSASTRPCTTSSRAWPTDGFSPTPSHGRSRTGRRRCSCSTWTGSRRSTTPSATRLATTCCAWWPNA